MLFNPFESQLVMLIALAVYATLIVLALVAVRYRLRRSSRWVSSNCPNCGGLLYRSHRRPVSRLISGFISLRRYYCVNPKCRWQGLRIKPLNKR